MTQGLTFYKSITGDTLLSLQVHQKRPVCPTCDNTFLSPKSFTIPFLFTRPASSNDITTFKIKNSSDTVIATLDNSLISILNAGDVDYIICNFQPIDELECEHYYYELILGTETYYSEIFRVIGKDPEESTSNIAVNGTFTGSLAGWTAGGAASWDAGGGGRASLGAAGDSISQAAPGDGMVRITINVLSTFTQGMEFSYGSYTKEIVPGDNTFYVPSGVTYTILNNDTVDFNAMTVEDVEIFQLERVECYNFIVARNSCNKNSIPYVETGYTDVLIVDAELYEPEYPRNDENEEDGNNDKSTTFLRIDKRWTMQTTNQIYEPMIDELVKLPANDSIYIFNDVWKKAFISDEETMDIEVNVEWLDTLKCNASAKIIITENLVLNNACCEVIENIGCCDEFTYELEETDPDIWELTLTSECPGMRFSYLVLNDDDEVIAEVEFTGSVEIDTTAIVDETYSVKGAKFGCDDIIYPLNLS